MKFKFKADGFYMEPGWATNEESEVKILKNFDIQSVIRAFREHLDYVRNHKRCNGLRNGHRERNHNVHGDWVVGSVWEKEDPSQSSDLEKSA